MTTSLKDVSSAQMINSLVEMNCFTQECTVFGYMWRNLDGHIKYTVSDNEAVIRQSFEKKVLERYALSPVNSLTFHEIIKDETKDDIWMYLKLKLCSELKDSYNEVYFKEMHTLSLEPADDQAWEILFPWLQELDGYYNEDELRLFDGAIDYAAITRHLTDNSYQVLKRWIQKNRSQILHEMQVQDNYTRTFGGFAYETRNGGYDYFYNANEKNISDRQSELERQGAFHTPIYSKQYWYHNSSDLKEVRKKFQAELRALMDETYFSRLDALRELKNCTLAAQWAACLVHVKAHCSEEAVEGFEYWRYRWNIE